MKVPCNCLACRTRRTREVLFMARVDGAGSLPHVRATYCGTCEGVTITATSRHGTGDLYRLARVGPYEVRY